uniref:Rho-GAP domain-containing protein n=1 Tax=Musa acuminata subsp. malaccensis TaxID=214687 RepID=A0A804L660_MUSAM|nr:PREDICTED: rho GTPase-activating protein 4-like isoform X2 [Musa acuminata subsp. malaccensis]
MAEVLRSPSHFASSPRRTLSCDPNDGSNGLLNPSNGIRGGGEEEENERRGAGGAIERKRETRRGEGVEEQQLSVLALLLTLFRKSLLGCKPEGVDDEDFGSMEIGCPTEVQHVAHVTFDRFHGFLGLPVEFEPEVPCRAPSASATVFGVSTESMQCSYDSRGNSVPTILLLMQRRLYEQGGLRTEGIFRINAENGQEEYVRDQLNNGIVPEGVDVHCLAGLIKAWFRELPTGLLDSLSFEQVMQCQTEEECSRLARLLPPTEAALLDWAINLMADVVQEEQQNKMNARNVATVFAPNMTQIHLMRMAITALSFILKLVLKRQLKMFVLSRNLLWTILLEFLKKGQQKMRKLMDHLRPLMTMLPLKGLQCNIQLMNSSLRIQHAPMVHPVARNQQLIVLTQFIQIRIGKRQASQTITIIGRAERQRGSLPVELPCQLRSQGGPVSQVV